MTLDDASRALARALPELEIEPVRQLDVGFGSIVLETSGGIVFRLARTAETASGHQLELKLLPALREHTDVPLPLPQWHVPAGHHPELPYGALGYTKLPGRTLSPQNANAELAAELGSFLRSIHAFPRSAAKRLGVPEAPTWAQRVRELARFLPFLAGELAEAERETLDAWYAHAPDDPAMSAFTSKFLHGDAWYGNLLVDGSPARLAGVLDWEGVRVGDPAEDLVPQHYLGHEFAEAVLAAYGADTALRYRVEGYRGLREFAGVGWAIEQRDAAELAESIEKLRRTPILAA